MNLLSFWSRASFQYGLSFVLVLFYMGAVWIAFNPNTTPEYRDYYIDQTSHCYHKNPPARLVFEGKIRFGLNQPAQSCTTLLQGWSWQEPWGTWSDGPFSEIDFVTDSDAHQNAQLRFHLFGFAPLTPQTVQVFLNERWVAEWSLAHEAQTAITLEVPIAQPEQTMRLGFYFERPLALDWFGKSSNPIDRRTLSMGLLGFEWDNSTDLVGLGNNEVSQ